MATQFPALTAEQQQFIEQQHIYFVGSAAAEGQVNVSPKGQDSLRVLASNKILWQNLTGSGNETATHLSMVNRMTLMWCAFTGPPLILRVYGRAQTIHPRDSQWQQCTDAIPEVLGARQYFLVDVDLVQTSCGYAVPEMDFQEDRVALQKWTDKKGERGIEEYWQSTNTLSLDGKPTGIVGPD